MGKRLPTADEVADAYVTGGELAQPKYEKGIDRTDNWQEDTLDGEANYEEGVRQAITQKKFGKGVSQISDAEWKAAAKAKADRLPSGIREAKPKFQKNMAPVLDHIQESLDKLPKRGIAGSAANKARMDSHFEHMKTYKKD